MKDRGNSNMQTGSDKTIFRRDDAIAAALLFFSILSIFFLPDGSRAARAQTDIAISVEKYFIPGSSTSGRVEFYPGGASGRIKKIEAVFDRDFFQTLSAWYGPESKFAVKMEAVPIIGVSGSGKAPLDDMAVKISFRLNGTSTDTLPARLLIIFYPDPAKNMEELVPAAAGTRGAISAVSEGRGIGAFIDKTGEYALLAPEGWPIRSGQGVEVLGVESGAREAQLLSLAEEARSLSSWDFDKAAAGLILGPASGPKLEESKYVYPKADLSGEEFAVVDFFIEFGTRNTEKLGKGERRGVVASFNSAYGKLPVSEKEWLDVLKIASGRFPGNENASALGRASIQFRKIYVRQPGTGAQDQAALKIIAYGLRPEKRNLSSEGAAIEIFKHIFHSIPASSKDWDAVRAIAYSGSAR
jgi:hypothetical protein